MVSMDIDNAQVLVAEQYRTDTEAYLSALEPLIDALLQDAGDDDWCSKFPNFIDGVLFELSEAQPDHFTGHGIAYILGNKDHVEPVSVKMRFSPDGA